MQRTKIGGGRNETLHRLIAARKRAGTILPPSLENRCEQQVMAIARLLHSVQRPQRAHVLHRKSLMAEDDQMIKKTIGILVHGPPVGVCRVSTVFIVKLNDILVVALCKQSVALL